MTLRIARFHREIIVCCAIQQCEEWAPRFSNVRDETMAGKPPLPAHVLHHLSPEPIPEEEEVEGGVPVFNRVGGETAVSSSSPKGHSWNEYFDETFFLDVGGDKFQVFLAGTKGPLVVCFHGGGHSSLSWAHMAKLCKADVRVAAFDCVGHGGTECKDETDFSKERLVRDGVAVTKKIWERCKEAGGEEPDILLVGHSMGGAIASRVAATEEVPRLGGLVVLDVVEGTALEALGAMRSVVSRFPSRFASLQEAIDWTVKSGTVQNRESAMVSVPSQLCQNPDGSWKYRLDLMKTEPFWDGWFRGLSEVFLAVKVARMLVLAGHDRLDKPLMIAQMQGKFQVALVPQSGHVIEEDQPERVAGLLVEFAKRYRLKG
uniref:Protein phosphatase methylesterase 1 n=1 Tax=Chromera velia CCMP2878 TaxID=1169474 RepID=A0A0G4FBD7_9ALVE|eukprot:Cvel_16042.t1-p1 / transcript=Cvel_16042.t1 / gene=Cvel_16042 / organism=Chromera_velia_CCMP2878 / gene_product=Probable protein phosphatase methylesterase 1, putative / transcript_product=Probable protein phosphatase methylesterase 1, putative / location=Cvel_scaffold1218:49950-51068(+) / protein_length=373 / sequence_SO=supercontig / SO=protein_coding / is_pseudo=false